MASVRYKLMTLKIGVLMQERITINDACKPVTLDNLNIRTVQGVY